MKTIITIALFLLAANLSFAQTSLASLEAANKIEIDPNYMPESSQFVIDQIREYLIKNVDYPELMINNSIEGTVVVKVLLSKDGKIHQSKIAKSLHSTFDTEVLETMKKIQKIDTRDHKYKAAYAVYVPIKFSLTY